MIFVPKIFSNTSLQIKKGENTSSPSYKLSNLREKQTFGRTASDPGRNETKRNKTKINKMQSVGNSSGQDCDLKQTKQTICLFAVCSLDSSHFSFTMPKHASKTYLLQMTRGQFWFFFSPSLIWCQSRISWKFIRWKQLIFYGQDTKVGLRATYIKCNATLHRSILTLSAENSTLTHNASLFSKYTKSKEKSTWIFSYTGMFCSRGGAIHSGWWMLTNMPALWTSL